MERSCGLGSGDKQSNRQKGALANGSRVGICRSWRTGQQALPMGQYSRNVQRNVGARYRLAIETKLPCRIRPADGEGCPAPTLYAKRRELFAGPRSAVLHQFFVNENQDDPTEPLWPR